METNNEHPGVEEILDESIRKNFEESFYVASVKSIAEKIYIKNVVSAWLNARPEDETNELRKFATTCFNVAEVFVEVSQTYKK